MRREYLGLREVRNRRTKSEVWRRSIVDLIVRMLCVDAAYAIATDVATYCVLPVVRRFDGLRAEIFVIIIRPYCQNKTIGPNITKISAIQKRLVLEPPCITMLVLIMATMMAEEQRTEDASSVCRRGF